MSSMVSILVAFLWSAFGYGPVVPSQQPTPVAASSPQRALLDQYCVGCHNDAIKTAGIILDKADVQHVGTDPATWERVVQKLRAHQMPPAGRPRPDKNTYEAFRVWLENELDKAAVVNSNPGTTVSYHRLNRLEYQNAVKNLLDVDVDASAFLPEDPASFGFDNIGGAIKMSPDLMET